MRRQLGGLGTLFILALGFGLLHNPPTTNTLQSLSKPTSSKISLEEQIGPIPPGQKCPNPKCAAEGVLSAIDSFFFHQEALGQRHKKGIAPLLQEFGALRKRGDDVQFVIAIVPDPVHTHLSLFFDRAVDAIEQGAQQENWIFDRATMPWDSQQHTESTDYRVRLLQQDYQAENEKLPGLMIFRPSDQSSHKLNSGLFVLVVGETPTGGINKEQFESAVEMIGVGKKTEEPLRIIGPTFSGSLFSLAHLLTHDSVSNRFTAVAVRSGTVSSWFATQSFESWIRQEKSLAVDFATFMQSDRYMLRKFIRYERIKGFAPAQVAVLSEDETAYGNFASAVGVPEAENQNSKCPAGDGMNADDEATLQLEEGCVVHLYFPRDISQLRSAYQQGLDKQPSNVPSGSYEVHTILPLNLEDTGSDDDSVSQYAHSETPLSQEAILLGILTALRKHRIEHVILQATNPIDTLFLSRFLRKGYPEGRVVTTGADLLLRRDVEDDSLLHGVMSLSTYSLLPGAGDENASPSRFTGTPHAHQIFPAAVSVGIFNATISQLAESTSVSSSKNGPSASDSSPQETLPVGRYSEYGWPLLGGTTCDIKEPLVPVVWLTVLGRDGYWPVAVLDDGNSVQAGLVRSSLRPIVSDLPSGARAKGECFDGVVENGVRFPKFGRHSPLVWKILYGLVLGLVAAYVQLLRKSSIRASSSMMTQLAPVRDRRRAVLIAIISWFLLTLLLLLLWPWMHWPMMTPSAIFYLICMLIGLLCIFCLTELTRREDVEVAIIFTAGAAVIIILLLGVYGSRTNYTQNPFLYRYIHLSSGVSPLLPFLCLLAAGLWWGWFSITGLALVDKRHPKLPMAKDLPSLIPQGHATALVRKDARLSAEATQKLLGVMQPAGWDIRVLLPAFFGVIVTLLALDFDHPVLTIESQKFERGYVLALGFATLALFSSLSRLLVTWLECRKLLGTLDRFPFRRAFGELHFAWEPIWRLGGGRLQELYWLVSRQLETLEQLRRALVSENGSEADALRTSINETAERATWLQGPDGQRSNEAEPDLSEHLVQDFGDLQDKIAQTCAKALAYLQPKWWEKDGVILREVDSTNGADKNDNLQVSPPVRLAERFVALVYLNYIFTVLLRMRTLAVAAGGIYIFLLLSVNSYPFEPKVALRSVAILLLILLVGTVGYSLAQMSRNTILSLVTQTRPGELGLEFWMRMGVFVALPLLSLLVSQFPALNNALFSWLEPALSALK